MTSLEHVGDPLLCPNRPPWRVRCVCIVCRAAPDPRPRVQLTRAGEIAMRLQPQSQPQPHEAPGLA